MKKKTFQVSTTFTFNGVFKVVAFSKEEAREMVEQSCGMTLTGGITSTLNDEDFDWQFDVHPEKSIGKITL